MRIVKAEGGNHERMVLIGMIVDKTVLSAVASKWAKNMFSSRWGNIIGGWCVDYYHRYKKPPGENIQSLFDDWSMSNKRDKETVEQIALLLSQLSGQYAQRKKQVNPEYAIDLATTYFNRVKFQELKEELEAKLEDGDVAGADRLVSEFNKIELGLSAGIDVLNDDTAIERAFSTMGKPIIRHRHGLKTLMGNALERDAFVAFMGPEKRGKTWHLLDLAWRGMIQGNKVAFFEVGDLSEAQIMRRFMVRASKHPLRPCVVKWPVSLIVQKYDKVAKVDFKEIQFTSPLDTNLARESCKKIISKLQLKGDSGPNLRLSVHPNSSISVNGIKSIIDGWERQGWVPDVVIVDYADILAPMSGSVDSREQINMTWKGLRSLSQQLHCLVVTATQAKASSYTRQTMTKEDFSEDKRKFAHVTGMIGLNATSEEKAKGIIRMNWIVLREEDFIETQCCHIATCYSVANPTVLSYFP